MRPDWVLQIVTCLSSWQLDTTVSEDYSKRVSHSRLMMSRDSPGASHELGTPSRLLSGASYHQYVNRVQCAVTALSQSPEKQPQH
ncbi:hypothetical protein AAE478_005196 [Parahypoxylon ruwenzoriense]